MPANKALRASRPERLFEGADDDRRCLRAMWRRQAVWLGALPATVDVAVAQTTDGLWLRERQGADG